MGDVNLRVVANGSRSDWVDYRSTKMSTIRYNSVRRETGEILAAESNDFALSGEESEFIFAALREGRELDAFTVLLIRM